MDLYAYIYLEIKELEPKNSITYNWRKYLD